MQPIADFRFAPVYDLAVASLTGCGPVTRAENQDNFVVIDFEGQACRLEGGAPRRSRVAGWPRGHGRVAVLDGMGGHGHGREAAEAVAAGLLAIPPCTGVDELARRLDALHAELQERFAQAAEGASGSAAVRPGTTLTLLELPAGGAPLLYHVGDSRLYELRPDQAVPLTVDHVPATGAALAGRLDEAGWWRQVHGQHTPQIAQAFILGNTFADPAGLADSLYPLGAAKLPPWLAQWPDRRVLALRADCAYLLATDGFWSCVRPDAFVCHWPLLFAGAADAAAILDRLFGALEHDPPPGLHPDNLTALVLRPLPQQSDETALPTDTPK
ncbi:protein phosphatase [Massilia sp. KIM]|uniref:PP2C family protein-serine/threonine phosphatase n=1 Tax=Massilia sp. KIM TaxID=1955422 RepID=UPI0009CB0871|nr:protein phosphatase [Massilia sp. KIM]OON63317.1 protein phosphatase [Massilia sp. KIM]